MSPIDQTRLDRLLHLRGQVDQAIRDERARLARRDGLIRRLPIDLAVSPLLILDAVCADFHITTTDMYGPSQEQHLAEARACLAWIARDAGLRPREAASLGHTSANYICTRVRRVEGTPILLHRAITIRDRAIAQNQDAA